MACGGSTLDQAAETGAPTFDPIPIDDLDAAEMLRLTDRWNGDFDQIGDRRFIRVLVTYNRALYYLDRAEQRGIAVEAMRQFEQFLAARTPKGAVAPKIVIIPTYRGRLFRALAEGYGDIAMAGITMTEARTAQVAFSEPTMEGIRDIVVSGPSAPPIDSLDDLAGQAVHVRPSSSYHEDLVALNEQFAREGKPPVDIRPVDERLEDEDVLQMVDAGVLPVTVVKSFAADFLSQLYDRLRLHENLELRSDGRLAWAVRREAPRFLAVVNEFVRSHRAGTLFGNIMLKRYVGSAERLRNPTADAEVQRFQAVVGHFQKYGAEYDIDWVLAAAQGYQESRLDQSVRSPAGAVGIMQIKPATAADMGIRGIDRTEANIHAGIKYLRWVIDQFYKDEPMERLDKMLFALASYNAGPARVRQLRDRADRMGLDPNVWFHNVEIVAARQIGRETVDYVSNIYKYYVAYKALVSARDARREPSPGRP